MVWDFIVINCSIIQSNLSGPSSALIPPIWNANMHYLYNFGNRVFLFNQYDCSVYKFWRKHKVTIVFLKMGPKCSLAPPGGTPYNGLYQSSAQRCTFFRLQIYEKVGISLVDVRTFVILLCEKTKGANRCNFISLWLWRNKTTSWFCYLYILEGWCIYHSWSVLNYRYVKGVTFVNRRYMKEVPFLSKMVYKKVEGWSLWWGVDRIRLCSVNTASPRT